MPEETADHVKWFPSTVGTEDVNEEHRALNVFIKGGGDITISGDVIVDGVTDAGPGWTSSFGVSGARFTSADQHSAVAPVTDAPTTGEKLVITDLIISVDTAMRVDFSIETGGTILLSLYLPANGTVQFTPRSKLKLATADKKLMVRTSVAGNIAVTPFYFSEA